MTKLFAFYTQLFGWEMYATLFGWLFASSDKSTTDDVGTGSRSSPDIQVVNAQDEGDGLSDPEPVNVPTRQLEPLRVVTEPEPEPEPDTVSAPRVKVEEVVEEPEPVKVTTPTEEAEKVPAEPEPVTVPAPQIKVEEVVEEPEPVKVSSPTVEVEDSPVSPVKAPQTPQSRNDPLDGPETGENIMFFHNEKVSVDGGRVSTLELDTSRTISKIEITNDPSHGNATVNPDNTISLVMSGSDYAGPMSLGYKVTYGNGNTETKSIQLQVSEPSQKAGWGKGEHYMLAEDSSGDIIVETGEIHRKIYVTESDDALTKADIAALEGISANKITTAWLRNHEEYGSSEDTALATDMGMDLWKELTNNVNDKTSSHWLLFEKGYTYSNLDGLIQTDATGESELHPLHITSWGNGDRPVLRTQIKMFGHEGENIVISDVEVSWGLRNTGTDNTLFSDVHFTGINGNLVVQGVDNFTLHDSEVTHITTPVPDGDNWNTKVSGLFAHNTDGILIEGSIFHRNGWEEGYSPDGSTDYGMSPNMFSHNVYLQASTSDVTFRDNIISQAASVGAQLRGGAFAEDNLFVDNNIGVNFLGGTYKNYDAAGNFTLFADNVVTSAGYKDTTYFNGAISQGISNEANDSTLLDNLVAHLANPDDPKEIAFKSDSGSALHHLNDRPVYDDTIVYNWAGSDPSKVHGESLDRNTQDVNASLADKTTIQNYAESITGKANASITDLMNHLIAQAETNKDDAISAEDIVDYFQKGFGITPEGSEDQTDHRFVPNNLADGIRWDNKLNWDTEDVPDDGDNVFLAGNWVQFAGTVSVGDLHFGDNGKLAVNSGKLAVTDMLTTGQEGARVEVDGAGQFWSDGYSGNGMLDLQVDGGRFANTGLHDGTSRLAFTDNAQGILATNDARLELNTGSKLIISGSDAKVGFDGVDNGLAILDMNNGSTLRFNADSDGISTLGEFRSGYWDHDEPEVQSGISLDGLLQLDLTKFSDTNANIELANVDMLHGSFDDLKIFGLGARDATVTVDYTDDTVLLSLTSGRGRYDQVLRGQANDAITKDSDLWKMLTQGQGTLPETLPNDANTPELEPLDAFDM